MPSITAEITQPNCPILPNVDYSFDMENLNSIDEFKQGLYKYLRFSEKKILQMKLVVYSQHLEVN